MGLGNIKLAYAFWSDLPGAQFKALVYMAYRSWDTDTPPEYRAGWEELAFAIGYRDLPDEPDPDDESATATAARKRRKGAAEAVRVVIKGLLKAGVIETHRPGTGGRKAKYGLHLGHLPAPAKPRGSSPGETQGDSPWIFQGGAPGKRRGT